MEGSPVAIERASHSTPVSARAEEGNPRGPGGGSLKVVVVHNRYRSSFPSGEDEVVDREVEALRQFGHHVELLERRSDEIARFSLVDRALVPGRVVWSPGPAHELEHVVRTLRPDVVHVHNVFPLISPAVLRTCTRMRVPCVVTFHNYEQLCVTGQLYRTGHDCTECAGRRLPLASVVHGCYRNSRAATVPRAASAVVNRSAWQRVPSAYIFISDAQRRRLQHGYPPTRCFVKGNFAPVHPGGVGSQREHLVAYMGRLAEVKGVRVLLEAWDRYLALPGPSLRLAIAGTGPLESEVRTWAASRPSVDVLGLLDRRGCADLAGRALAMVVPSLWHEPFGLVVVEAMAAGAIPIASTRGSFPELIVDGVDGLLAPPGNAAALCERIWRLGTTPEWAGSLGTAARQTYARRFSPEPVTEELEAIYRFAVAHPR